MKLKASWADDLITLGNAAAPMVLILLSLFTPSDVVDEEKKDDLFIAGLTALVTGGFRGLGKKTEITQEVQRQELNVAPSSDNYYQYNPPSHRGGVPNGNYAPYQPEHLSQIAPEDASYLESREPVASSPYRVVSPDELED
jgi:hypothetical protein